MKICRDPRALGLSLIKTIYLGGCGVTDPKHHVKSGELLKPSLAHAHVMACDPGLGSVCLEKDNYLFNSDGTYSDIILHEYAHIMNIPYFKNAICGSSVNDHAMALNDEEIGWTTTSEYAHKSQFFIDAMESLGQVPRDWGLEPY